MPKTLNYFKKFHYSLNYSNLFDFIHFLRLNSEIKILQEIWKFEQSFLNARKFTTWCGVCIKVICF